MRWTRPRRSLVGIYRKASRNCDGLWKRAWARRGKREYVQTLRLLETFKLPEVSRAIEDALRLGAISFDAVKHLLLCRIERRPARLDLENYPHLPTAQVATTAAADYLALLEPGGLLMYGHAAGLVESSSENTAAARTFLRESTTKSRSSVPQRAWIFPRYLLRIERARTAGPRTARHRTSHPQAKFDVVKSLDTFDFLAIPSLNKALVLDLGPLRVHRTARKHPGAGKLLGTGKPTSPWLWAWPLARRLPRPLHHRSGISGA